MIEPSVLFQDVVYTTKLEDIDNRALEEECFVVKKNLPSAAPVRKYYQSPLITDTVIRRQGLINFLQLQDMIQHQLNSLTERYNSNYKLKLLPPWIMINPPGTFCTNHVHPGFQFSGVYYVRVPGDSRANITFYRDRSFSDYSIETLLGGEDTPESRTFHEIPSQEGHLLMFPSYLSHDVQPNRSKSDRISIAFNAVM